MDNPNLPNYQHPYYREILPALIYLRDMWFGKYNWYRDGQIHDRWLAYKYLPPEQAEPKDAYLARIARSRFEQRFRNAIEKDMAGLLSQFQLMDASRSLLQYQDDIDLRGNNLKVFLKEADKLALRDKHCFILVDYPPTDDSIVTEADRLASGRRPYLVLIERHQVINWFTSYRNGREVLELLVIKETVREKEGMYGIREIEQYRVLTPGAYAVYRIVQKDGKSIAVLASDEQGNLKRGETSLDYIPVIPYSLTHGDLFGSNIDFPLLDLADLNLELYQLESEKREILHKCNIPVFVIDRRDADKNLPKDADAGNQAMAIGCNTLLYDLDARWVEPTGNAIAATQHDIEKLQERIDTRTLAFLSGSQIARTATEAELDASQARANFMGLAAQKESTVAEIFKIWAEYEAETNIGRIEVSRDLLKAPLTLSFREIADAIAQGIISRRLGLQILKQKQVLGDEFSEADLEAELALTGESLGLNLNPEEVLG